MGKKLVEGTSCLRSRYRLLIIILLVIIFIILIGVIGYLTISLIPWTSVIFKKEIVINRLNLTREDIQKLSDNDQDVKEIVFRQINGLLQKQFKDDDGTIVTIEKGDIKINAEYQDKLLADSCDARVTVFHPKLEGSLLDSSNISSGLQISTSGLNVFMEATLDAEVNVDLDLRVELGKKIFKKCVRIRETLGMNLTTTGKVLIVVKISGTNLRMETEKSKLLLKFKLKFDLEGKPFDWNVDNVDVSKCEIGGNIKFGSYCGLAKKLITDGAQKYLNKWTSFNAPKLVEKLEKRLQKKIGDEMSYQIIER